MIKNVFNFKKRGLIRSKKASPYVELVIAFVLIDLINFLFFRSNPCFLNLTPHPYWLIILLIASRYGFMPGFLSGVIAAFHFLGVQFDHFPTKTDLEYFIEIHGFILPSAFVFVGMVLGEMREKQLMEISGVKEDLSKKNATVKNLEEQIEATEKARRNLENRIVGETTTVKTLYETAKHFESLKEEEIYTGCLEMLVKHLQVEKVSLYTIEGDHFVLKSAQGWGKEEMVEGKIPLAGSLLGLVVQEQRLLTVKDILQMSGSGRYSAQYGNTLALVPIRLEDGKPFGVVNIEKMDFLALNKTNLQLIELVVNWAGKAIEQIWNYNAIQKRNIWNDDYQVYTHSFFEHMLPMEFNRAKTFQVPMSLGLLKVDQFGFLNEQSQVLVSKSLLSVIKKCCDQTDYAFQYKFRGVFLVIFPMKTRLAAEKSITNIKKEFSDISKNIQNASPLKLIASLEDIKQETQQYNELLNSVLQQGQIAKV